MGMTTSEKYTETARLHAEGRCLGTAPRGGAGAVAARRSSASAEDRLRPCRETVPEVRRPGSSARGPQERVEQAQLGFGALALAAALTAVVVIVLLGTAHARAAATERLDPRGGSTVVDIAQQDGVSDVGPR